MIKRELIDYTLTLPSAWEDYPFDDVTAVMRHSGNKKMFALISEGKESNLTINLKCDPLKSELLRSLYKGVMPGYHMNKTHWNTVAIDSDVPLEEIYAMIQESFDLTKPKKKKGACKN